MTFERWQKQGEILADNETLGHNEARVVVDKTVAMEIVGLVAKLSPLCDDADCKG